MSEYTAYVEREVDESITRSIKDIEDMRVKIMESIGRCDSVGDIAHGVHDIVREAMHRIMHVGAHPDCGARHEHLIKSVLIMEHLMLPVIHCMLERPGREGFVRFKEALINRVLGVFDHHVTNMRSAVFRQKIVETAISRSKDVDAAVVAMLQEEGDSNGKKPTFH